jgi:hypothetical protein
MVMKFLLYSTTPSLTVEKAGDNGFRLRSHTFITADGYCFWWGNQSSNLFFYGSEFANAIASIQAEGADYAERTIHMMRPGVVPSEDIVAQRTVIIHATKLKNITTNVDPAILTEINGETVVFKSQHYTPYAFGIPYMGPQGGPALWASSTIVGVKATDRNADNAYCYFKSNVFYGQHNLHREN